MLWIFGTVLAAACLVCLVGAFLVLAVIGAVLRFLRGKRSMKRTQHGNDTVADDSQIVEGEYVEIE